MEQLIQGFPGQIKEGIEAGREYTLSPGSEQIKAILIAGMGGSGIGGDYVAQLGKEECSVPVFVNKEYDIPGWVDKHTLAIVSSYSGNTEETVAGLNQLMKTGARVVCIASGGQIAQIAKAHNLDFISLPAGIPSPRACLGYSFTAQIFVLHKLGLLGKNVIEQLRLSADLLKFEQDEIKLKAEKISRMVVGKILVFYGTEKVGPVLLRWRQQMNENAKMLCWHHTIPEMNHNEIVGWHEKNENLAAIFLRNRDDSRRNSIRLDFVKQSVAQFTPTVVEVYAKGQSHLERMMYLTHLGDWVSWYIARLKGVDASEIRVIDKLKNLLSEQE